MKTSETKPCSFCGKEIPDSGVFGLPTYTDVPENHNMDCPIREVMEVHLADKKIEIPTIELEKIIGFLARCPTCRNDKWIVMISGNMEKPKVIEMKCDKCQYIARIDNGEIK